MAKQIRLTRKDIKQPDEFVTLTARAVSYVQDNAKLVSMVAAGLVLVFLVVLGVSRWFEAKERNAAKAYFSAVAEADKAEKAEQGGDSMVPKSAKVPEAVGEKFRQVAESYSGTTMGSLATIRAAHVQFQAGKYEEALKTYQQALNATSAKDPRYNLLLDAIAYAQENLGKKEEAAAGWQKLADAKLDFLRDHALYQLARMQTALNKKEEATKTLRKIKEFYPTSPYAHRAEEDLASASL